MPIYMDRHDLRGLKADDVAEAHRRDVDIQDRHGVKYMAYWFDENNGAAFCLVHAPDPATAERVHREAHGQIPNAIIPVDVAAVEAFLGRISDPRAVNSVEPTMSVNMTARSPESTAGAVVPRVARGSLIRPRNASTAARSTGMMALGIAPFASRWTRSAVSFGG